MSTAPSPYLIDRAQRLIGRGFNEMNSAELRELARAIGSDPDSTGLLKTWGPHTLKSEALAHVAERLAQVLDSERHRFAALPWHERLGISPDASKAKVNAAYRELAARHHPDKGGDLAYMTAINAARAEALEYTSHVE